MSAKLTLVAALGLSMIAVTGCKKDHHEHHSTGSMPNSVAPAGSKVAVAKLSASKNATTQPSAKNVAGTVTFTEIGSGVHIVADITGLEPNSKHGFHIHEKGDLTAPDLSSAGPHFDPAGTHTHGAPSQSGKTHAGDLGNLSANAVGTAHLEIDVPGVTLAEAPNGLLGRSVVVHGKADDLKTNPAGDSGPRIAAGKIELAK